MARGPGRQASHYRALELITARHRGGWSRSPGAGEPRPPRFAPSPRLMAVPAPPQPFLQDKQPHSFRSSRLFSAWLFSFRASSL